MGNGNTGKMIDQDGCSAAPVLLARRPGERALAEEMHVQVRNAFTAVAAVVDYEAVAGFSDAEFLGERSGSEQQVAEGGLVGGGGLADPGDEFLWDDQHVYRRLRIDVVNGDAEVVFVREFGGNLAIDDFLEESLHSKGRSPRNTQNTRKD